MSKSVLVIDTPKNCRECPAYNYNVPSSTCYCHAVHDDIGYARPARKLNKPGEYNFPIPAWCPLKKLPEKMHSILRQEEYSDGFEAGYNCINNG